MGEEPFAVQLQRPIAPPRMPGGDSVPTWTEDWGSYNLPACRIDEGIDGGWSKGTISGTKLKWHEGYVSRLERVSSREWTLDATDGGTYTAKLEGDGRLHWSDGDVWCRLEILYQQQKASSGLGLRMPAGDGAIDPLDDIEMMGENRAHQSPPLVETGCRAHQPPPVVDTGTYVARQDGAAGGVLNTGIEHAASSCISDGDGVANSDPLCCMDDSQRLQIAGDSSCHDLESEDHRHDITVGVEAAHTIDGILPTSITPVEVTHDTVDSVSKDVSKDILGELGASTTTEKDVTATVTAKQETAHQEVHGKLGASTTTEKDMTGTAKQESAHQEAADTDMFADLIDLG